MASKSKIINKLKQRWGITSTFQVVIILVVFACTGTSVLWVEALVRNLFGVPPDLYWYWSVALFVVLTLPLYNLLLLIFGFIFGQFAFFWNFEKKMIRRLCRLVVCRREA
jgi:hypothetical protein